MADCFSRTELLLGNEAMKKLAEARIIVFGVGGVGAYVIEALARCGVGSLDIVDNDSVSVTNINRQLIALNSTVGMPKTEVMVNRMKDINPDINAVGHQCFFNSETERLFDFSQYDYIVDAIDTVTAKLRLIEIAQERGIPIISCMGTGNKLDPCLLRIADISKTSVCPLARTMRYELRKRGINHVKVLFSTEEPRKAVVRDEESIAAKRNPPGSVSFVPSSAGLIIASEVIKDLTDK